jgi:GT2 family glycosyltransferase
MSNEAKFQPAWVADGQEGPVDVSVVLIGLNACRYILECIASLRDAQWPDCRYEVIYVDNGSRDDSVAQVRAHWPQVKLIANERNLGFCPAGNQAARVARGTHLYFLNDDTLVPGDAVARAWRTLRSRPEVGLVGSRLLNLDGSDQWSGRRFPTVWASVLGRRSWLARWFPKAAPLADYLCMQEVAKGEAFEVDWVSAAAMVIHVDVFWRIGGLAEDYYYWHEAVFCDRLRATGLKVVLDPQSKIVHYEGKGSGKRTYAVLRWHILDFHRGAYRCFCEHYRLSRWNPLRWLVGAGLAARAGLLLAGNWVTAPRT